MFEDYKKLRPFISEFTFGIKLQYKDFDKKEVVGVLVSSSSLLRKGSTMKRVRKLIRDMELDLKVDEYNDRLSFFRIRSSPYAFTLHPAFYRLYKRLGSVS